MTPLLSSALLRTQSDERLLALAADGHERAFEAIVDRYRRPLMRYLHRLLPGDRAEDVLQAAFVSAWTALRGETAVRELRPWLYRICHNAALNALARRGYDHAELTETFPGGASPVEALESRDALRQAFASLAELPERQRNALLAVAVEGRPPGEVARELGMSDGALRQLVHRARSTVRSAVTAVTPAPAIEWLAQLGARGNAPRIAELVGGAGIAGVAKAAAIVVATGAVVAGGAVHVAGHGPGPAVAAASAGPQPVAHVAPHAAGHSAHGAPARARDPHHRTVKRRITVSLGGRADTIVAPAARRRHQQHHPATPVTVSHGGSTEQAPTTPSSTPAPSSETPASNASTPEPAKPAATEPVPAPEPCHEVACRPVTAPTSTEPPPSDPPPATEPPPADPPPATEPPPADPPRI